MLKFSKGIRVVRNSKEFEDGDTNKIPAGSTGTVLDTGWSDGSYVYIQWDNPLPFMYQDFGSEGRSCWGIEISAIEPMEIDKQKAILDKIKYLYERNPLDKSRVVPTKSLQREQEPVPEVQSFDFNQRPSEQRISRTVHILEPLSAERIQRYVEQFQLAYSINFIQEQPRTPNADRQLRATTRTDAAVAQSVANQEYSERDRIRGLERLREQREQAEADRVVPTLTRSLIGRF